ncbi:putative enoyl- hydratase isomerase [Rosellinia necatrix]|uniref:Putative enoyl-hydratase isomerase n=1 Tax=Rosellinia necatrix TaxID=77044 RepID=A0A1S7UHR4_ROSNE|nr:putative enoyl- hydratase isomerase [Rosellinia necatrix]
MTAPSDTKLPPTLSSPPPAVPDTVVSFPGPHVLLVRLNRPRQLNAIPRPQHFALARLWRWYDGEASLRCAVLTGTGRAFCAGQDLKEWNSINHEDNGGSGSGSAAASSSGEGEGEGEEGGGGGRMPADGFGGLSNRAGKKPVVAAVNGLCLGGGMEMAINCDLVVAAAGATFGLPEVTIGVIALAGALPRLVRSVGRQRAAEMALGGRAGYGADEMLRWGLVNEVVPASSSSSSSSSGDAAVVDAALAWARRIAANSPDAVIVSREGLKLGWEGVGPAQATDLVANGWYARIEKGENFVEGVKSFNERRKPVWKDSKL